MSEEIVGAGGYVTNAVGDIFARELPRGRVEVDPASFCWVGPRGKAIPDKRRSIEQVASLTGFKVRIDPIETFIPGPRPPRPVPWRKWADGAAPPAAVRSRSGVAGTLSYVDRLTDALGRVAEMLPGVPARSPFHVYDFVRGRLVVIEYDPPPLQPGGRGTVYVLDDGYGIKIGHTRGLVAARVADLQTGNPRRIRTIATIGSASMEVEQHIHNRWAKWDCGGEWFRRDVLDRMATELGGWGELLRNALGPGNWSIDVYLQEP